MKVVFLDFDGVLNSLSDIAFGLGSSCFNAAAIERLNAIVRRSSAKVVVSSTWRVQHTMDELRVLLANAGFDGEIIGCTPVHSHDDARGLPDIGFIRCQEIQAWIDAHPTPLTSFVILDDLELEPMAAYHVKTDLEVGLCDHHVDEALGLLG
ncbi:MAG: hypothetical protein IPM54_28850 [Polyangiaceae bacterium]|nr:hypothetical protein [Polyangiaceae bacterium]